MNEREEAAGPPATPTNRYVDADGDQLSVEQQRTLDCLLASAGIAGVTTDTSFDEVLAPAWRSQSVAQLALGMASAMSAGRRVGRISRSGAAEWRVALDGEAGRPLTCRVEFDGVESALITRFVVSPELRAGLVVRDVSPGDMDSLARLEATAPVERSDGTVVRIDRGGTAVVQHRLVPEERMLAVFDGAEILAIQASVRRTAPIDGTAHAIAFNHGSRSDARSRRTGHMAHLIATLYWELFPQIDQFVSFVDVLNPAGMALGGGDAWPGQVSRLFLPVPALAAAARLAGDVAQAPLGHVASLTNATHGGNALYQARTAADVEQRLSHAADLYGPGDVLGTPDAVLGVWTRGFETRTYIDASAEQELRIAPVFDYGCIGSQGRAELTALLSTAAAQVQPMGISHLALFVPDGDERVAWLGELAARRDRYVVCAPRLDGVPVPSGPCYIDPILF